jgi:hypothetical protein
LPAFIINDRLNEVEYFLILFASTDQPGLALHFLCKASGAGIRNPDLHGAQTRRTKTLPVLVHLFSWRQWGMAVHSDLLPVTCYQKAALLNRIFFAPVTHYPIPLSPMAEYILVFYGIFLLASLQ